MRGGSGRAYRRRLAVGGLLAGGVAALAGAALWPAVGADPLEGRLGGRVETFDARFGATRTETAPFRRIYGVPDGRLLLDLAANGRVRQLTVGRERATNETWEPEPGDWTIERAQQLTRVWLPRDAAYRRREPFVFRDQVAGRRDVYESAALGAVFPQDVYVQHGAQGPPGLCAVTFYQTRTGSVAFALVGLY